MLEIFGIMMLCKANKKLALARGRRPGGYIALTIILCVGMELIGYIVSTALELEYSRYLIVYGFAGIGALISFLCAKFGPKGDYVDPNSVPPVNSFDPNVPSFGTYNVPVDQASYAPYQNAPANQYGMPVASKVNEFGMPVDDQGNFAPVLNQYGVPVDTSIYNAAPVQPVPYQNTVPVQADPFQNAAPVQNIAPFQQAPGSAAAPEADTAATHPNFCGYCGAKLEPGNKFCDSCGAKIG